LRWAGLDPAGLSRADAVAVAADGVLAGASGAGGAAPPGGRPGRPCRAGFGRGCCWSGPAQGGRAGSGVPSGAGG